MTDRAPFVPPIFGEEDYYLDAGVQKAVDLLEAATRSSGPLGRSGYTFEASRSQIEISNGMEFDDYSGIILNTENAQLLILLLSGWLKWKESIK